jgi:cell division protein FtsN
MSEPFRVPGGRQFWLSPPQVIALGVITVSLALLAFFLGVMVGRGEGASEGVATSSSQALVGADVQDDTITELLAKVEQAASRRTARAAEFSFPEELVASVPSVEVPKPATVSLKAVNVVSPDPGPPPAPEVEPEAAGDDEAKDERPTAPTRGWAIQVASYTNLGEADTRVSELESQGHGAWHVQGFAKGLNRYRVRIGPFSTEGDAEAALKKVAGGLPEKDLMLTRNE